MVLTEELRGALPNPLTEVVALSVSCLTENAYERVQHERLCLKLGFDYQWIRDVEALAPGGTMRDDERAVQTLVSALVERQGHHCRAELDAVIRAVGHQKAVAVLMLVGRYMTHALFVNCLDLAPPVASPPEVH
jgi:hypothetical protein